MFKKIKEKCYWFAHFEIAAMFKGSSVFLIHCSCNDPNNGRGFPFTYKFQTFNKERNENYTWIFIVTPFHFNAVVAGLVMTWKYKFIL